MRQYLDLLEKILSQGVRQNNRTGTDTLAIFGHSMRFDLKDGFPLLTTKRVFLKGIIHELLWFLRGDTNIKYLQDNGVHIWDEWADADGNLGPVYGSQWRNWDDRVDQIQDLVKLIRTNPSSRRQLVTAWNPVEVPHMALPPCHCLFQTAVMGGRLHMQLYQRSCDTFLGVPFNIASYSLLLMMLAQQTGLEPGEFVWTGGDVHLYVNHLDQARLQLTREPRPLPVMRIERAPSIFEYTYKDFYLENYDPHPAISAPVAV